MGSLPAEGEQGCAPITHPCCKEKIRGCIFGRGKGRHEGSKLGLPWHRSPPVCLLDISSPDLPCAGIFPFPVTAVLGKKASLTPWEGLCPLPVLHQCIIKKDGSATSGLNPRECTWSSWAFRVLTELPSACSGWGAKALSPLGPPGG